MTDEEKMKKLYFEHFTVIQAKTALAKAAQAEVKRVRKLAKGDGCNLADIDYMGRCAELEDPSIVPAELLRRIQIASWFALPVNFQPGLFEDREPLVDRAYREGERDAMLSKDASSNPYGMDSAAGQSFQEGWLAGRDKMAARMAAEMESNIIKRKQEQPVPETTDEKPETVPEAETAPPTTGDDEWEKAKPKLPPKPKAKKTDAAVH